MPTSLESPRVRARAWRAVALCVIVAALAACSTGSGTSNAPTAAIVPGAKGTERPPVKIALLLPLGGMGETAAIAKSMKQAAEMALFEVNDPSIQLITKDDGGTA